MPLKILNEGHGGIYVGGFQIAPDVLLITADNFGDAWEAMVDEFAERGSIEPCEHDGPEDEATCDAHDWGSSGGPYVTLDLTLRVVRPGRSD